MWAFLSRLNVPVLVACVVAVLAGTGCACKPAIVARDIEVTLDDSMVGKPVPVFFYAANGSEKGVWENYSVDELFTDGNRLRKGALEGKPDERLAVELTFDPKVREKVKTLSATDPIWKTWKAREGWDLFVLVYIPFSEPWKGGASFDPRRQVVSLDGCKWKSDREPLKLRVREGAITVEKSAAK